MRVLVVDDTAEDRRLLSYYLESRGHEVVQAKNGVEALAYAKKNPPDLVISDGLMPEMDGFNLLRNIRADERLADVPFVFYSSVFKDANEAELAESLGASAFIVKGADKSEFWDQLEGVLADGNSGRDAASRGPVGEESDYLRKYSSMVAVRLEREVRELKSARAALAADIARRERAEIALLQTNAQLERMVHDVVEAMSRVVEARDPYTQGHQERVANLCRQIAVSMDMGDAEVAAVEMAALVHDIGKLAVPAEILTKPGILSATEFGLIQVHPEKSYEILRGIAFPWPVADIVLQHHERMDGSGYPHGLEGDRILPTARVLAVADVVEAMASHRPYRPALGVDAAMAELRGGPDKYDRDVVWCCLSLYEQGKLKHLTAT
jgi:putative two-component system response regulator